MKKTMLALATSAVLAVATMTPTTADARCRGCGIAAGVFGGLLLGSAIASAAGPRYYYYDEPAPVYVDPDPVYVAPRGRCYADEEFWSPRYQRYVLRRVRVPCY